MPAFRSARFRTLLALASALLATGCPADHAGNSGGSAGTNGASSGTNGSSATADLQPSETRRIVVLTNGYSPFWTAVEAGMEAAAEELNLAADGYAVSLEVNDATDAGQIDKLRQLGTQSDVVAIGISVVVRDNPQIADELRALRDKGVEIVAIDSDFAPEFYDARLAYVGSNNLAAGRLLGKVAAVVMPAGGQYVTFVGRTSAHNAVERIDGFAEGAGAAYASADSMGDDVDLNRSQENVRNAIRNHPDLKMLVGIWSYNAGCIVDVVAELEVRERFKIVAFDADPPAIVGLEDGSIDALVVQNPHRMGYDGVRLLKALVEGDATTIDEMLPRRNEAGGAVIDTGLKVVVPDGDTPLKPEAFEGVEFFRLKDFREWLKRHNLSSS